MGRLVCSMRRAECVGVGMPPEGGTPARRACPERLSRRGITLLEVLISMFVMLVGLLGVMSLIPVGRFEMQRGAKIDRASACGRGAFREMKVRGMLNPTTWARGDNGTKVYEATAGVPYTWNATLNAGNFSAFAIDPLGVGTVAATNSFGSWFPYSAAAPTVKRIPRITLGPSPGITAAARAAMADVIFRWQDDLQFDESGSSDNLPRQVMQGTAKRLSVGDYSWLATVVHNPDMVSAANVFDVPLRVSVAVFYKRDLATAGAGERVCDLTNPAGIGETQLSALSTNPDLTAAPYSGDAKKFLDAKPGQWIMIASTKNHSATPPEWKISWQRVVAIDSEVDGDGTTPTPWTRSVTLDGPDHQFETTGSDPKNFAYLFDGVIAVYEKNMKLELDSMY